MWLLLDLRWKFRTVEGEIVKSQRADRKGHWPKGQPRSGLTKLEGQLVASIIWQRCRVSSMRAVARELGLSDRTVRRILAGIVRPSVQTRDRVEKFVTGSTST